MNKKLKKLLYLWSNYFFFVFSLLYFKFYFAVNYGVKIDMLKLIRTFLVSNAHNIEKLRNND